MFPNLNYCNCLTCYKHDQIHNFITLKNPYCSWRFVNNTFMSCAFRVFQPKIKEKNTYKRIQKYSAYVNVQLVSHSSLRIIFDFKLIFATLQNNNNNKTPPPKKKQKTLGLQHCTYSQYCTFGGHKNCFGRTKITPFLLITALEQYLLFFSIKLCAGILKKRFQTPLVPF